MRDILILTKVLYKNAIGKVVKEEKSKIGKIILFIFVFAYISGIIGWFSYQTINSLIEINQEELFITATLLIICGFTMFRTLFTAISVLYFSKDVELLVPMPIKPIKIVFAKFNVMVISNFIAELLLFMAPYLIYWYLLKLSVLFLIYSILVLFIITIIPMLLASAIIVLIMSTTKFLRNKDIVQYITVGISMAVIVGMQIWNSSLTGNTDFVLANKLYELNGISSAFSKYFFTVGQAVKVLSSETFAQSLKNLAVLYAESIIAFMVVVFLISKTYLKSVLAMSSSGIKSRKLKLGNSNRNFVGKTYILKEFKILCRTPIFLFQCVLPSIIFPIIMFYPICQQITEGYAGTGDLFKATNELYEYLNDSFTFGLILMGINFLYVFNYISVTSISREGANATFMKYIPVPLSRQYKYKAMPGVLLNLFPLSYVLALLKIVFPQIDIVLLVEIAIVGVLSSILVNYFAVMIDVLNPKLIWDNEYVVVKQNINMLYNLFLNLAIIGIIYVISKWISNINVLALALSAIMICCIAIFEIFLCKYQRKIFRRIS